MADSDSGDTDATPSQPARGGTGKDEPSRGTGTLERLLSELIRRSASLGFSGLLVTEEALRRALSDRVPGEWIEFVSRQGDELRRDMLDRLTKEFGQWLRTQEPAALVEQILERYEVSVQVELRPVDGPEGERPAAQGPSLRVVARPR